MSLYVLSDLHITDSEDPIYHALIRLFRERVAPGDTVVLAGDVFDLFVGNKTVFTERFKEFISEAKRAGAAGTKIHYIEGNHDFLIQKAFGSIQNLNVHSHDTAVEIEGRKFFFAHGDTVDPSDYGYRTLRAFFRSPVMKALVATVPGAWLDWFGKTSSAVSRTRKPVLPASLSTEKIERLRKLYRSFAADQIKQGYDYVVMGHCHDLDEMCFHVDGRPGQYINVGYPRVHGSFLSWNSGDEKIQREALP